MEFETRPLHSRGNAAVATLCCGALGVVVAGPVGALLGGTLGFVANRLLDGAAEPPPSCLRATVRLDRDAISESSGVTYFGVDVIPADGGRPWRVRRRFNDFLRLSRLMDFGGLPGKTWLACRGPQLDARRSGLEAWLQGVVALQQEDSPPRQALALQRFLAFDREELPSHFQAPIPGMPSPGAPLPDEGAAASDSLRLDPGNVMTLTIPVPAGMTVGQDIDVDLPDGQRFRIQLPDGAGEVLQLTFDPIAGTLTPVAPAEYSSTSGLQTLSVLVPTGVEPGQSFYVQVPSGRLLPVVLPQDAVGQASMRLRYDPSAGLLEPAL